MGRTTSKAASPAFIVDPQSVVRNNGRQIDWTKVSDDRRTTPGFVVTTSGAALAAATAIPVVALAGAIKKDTILDFTGTGEYARVSADVAAGATSIPVEALDAGVESGDTAIVPGSGDKFLPAGTVLVEATSGSGQSVVKKVSPRVGGSGTAVGLLATDANEKSTVEAKSGYGVITGAKVYETLLPDAAGSPRTLDSTIKSELAALPDGFSFESYTDSSAA